MIRTPVASSNLCAVGYDFTSRTLEIEFNDGSVYRYSGVPENVYRALMSAGSHGRYFAAFIKDCYPYRRGPVAYPRGVRYYCRLAKRRTSGAFGCPRWISGSHVALKVWIA